MFLGTTCGASRFRDWGREVGAVKLMVDAKTRLIEQENVHIQLRSLSPGKLVRFVVDSGVHINAGEAYTEIKVLFRLSRFEILD